jgi:GDPmannose 4,6-dehydratase
VSNRKIIVIGSRGQDGALLCRQLADRNCSVTEVARGIALPATGKPLDILDADAVNDLVGTVAPDEIYYLAAHHQSAEEKVSGEALLFRDSLNVNVMGLVNFLDAARLRAPQSRIFYAASSHVFGTPSSSPQDESTPLNPENVYGIAKTAGIHACRYYRRQHGLFASTGILFNHESVLRSPKFLSRKIAVAVARIKQGRADHVVLGNLEARVDWGYAPDYVEAMQRILATDQPGDFVVATGETHSVRELAEKAFGHAGLDYRKHVKADASLVDSSRPVLTGNASLLKDATGWVPTKSFDDMIVELVEHELGEA